MKPILVLLLICLSIPAFCQDGKPEIVDYEYIDNQLYGVDKMGNRHKMEEQKPSKADTGVRMPQPQIQERYVIKLEHPGTLIEKGSDHIIGGIAASIIGTLIGTTVILAAEEYEVGLAINGVSLGIGIGLTFSGLSRYKRAGVIMQSKPY